MRKLPLFLFFTGAAAIALYYWQQKHTKPLLDSETQEPWPAVGELVHIYNGVPIYSNGEKVYTSYGKHYAEDGYYYGRKWQCVEFIKRYYHDAHDHQMPNVWGHAKDFFDDKLAHGSLNTDRAMQQFRNGYSEKPQVNDLLVWNEGQYGHVAIISEVSETSITVVQQNIKNGAQATFPMTSKNGHHTILSKPKAAGWLRLCTPL